jgi:hypothetical protein
VAPAGEGTFSQLRIDNKIRVGFLNETTSTGETPYFAYVPATGVSSEVIGAVDKTCDYTPRLAKLFPGQPITGEIKVFACASSPNEERDLAADPARPTILRAQVSEFRVSDDGKLITMKASVLGIDVTYQLQRQPLPLDLVLACGHARLGRAVAIPPAPIAGSRLRTPCPRNRISIVDEIDAKALFARSATPCLPETETWIPPSKYQRQSSFNDVELDLLREAAARNNVPAVYANSEWVRDGGLLSYAVDQVNMFRRAASYADRILRGAKPGELPVQ